MTRDGSLVIFGFRANAFLHQMVRATLEARERPIVATLAPARGLTLERVVYGARGR